MSVFGEHADRTIRGYFVSASEMDIPPDAGTGIIIDWTNVAIGAASIFHAINYDIIATTHSSFADACEQLINAGASNGPMRPVLNLDVHPQDDWSDQLGNLLSRTLPVQCFGRISDRGAQIADHVFFSVPNTSLYSLLLLRMDSTDRELRKRFRHWSVHLHPDRFETFKDAYPGLVNRMEVVYDRVCEAYRTLSDPYARALHNYWLNQAQYDRALALDEGSPIAELKRIHETPAIRAQLIDALSSTEFGHWSEAVEKLDALSSKDPHNRNLQDFVATLSQINNFVEQERGNTSLI